MLNTRIMSLTAGLLALAGTATAQQPGDTARNQNRDAGPTAQPEQRHPFEGVVATVDGNKITINAEGIPGMKQGATTLPYTVADGANLTQFTVGDHVTGEMIVRDNRTFVENVRITGKADDDKNKVGGPEVKPESGEVKAEAKEQYGEVKGEVNAEAKKQHDQAIDASSANKDQPNPEAKKQHDQAVGAATDVKAEGQGEKSEKKTPPDSAEAPAGPSQTGYTDWNDPSAKVYPFEGSVFEVNPEARRITIDAKHIPGNPGGETALPYVVPDSVEFSTFHEGDKVVGELQVKDNRTTVRSVRLMSSKADQDAVKNEQKQDKKDKEEQKEMPKY